MADKPVDYSQGYEFLHQIDRRIGYLEKDLEFIQLRVNSLESSRHDNFLKLSEDLQGLKNALVAVKNNFRECNHAMSLAGKDMKNSIKKDDVAALSSRIDEIKFEEFLTRKSAINEIMENKYKNSKDDSQGE